MRFDIEKSPAPKGTGYALKSSMLQNALTARGIDCNVHLVYSPSRPDPVAGYNVLECFYWLPNRNVEYDRFYIRIGTVLSVDGKAVLSAMQTLVIPALLDWIDKIKKLPADSTLLKKDMRFAASFCQGIVGISN